LNTQSGSGFASSIFPFSLALKLHGERVDGGQNIVPVFSHFTVNRIDSARAESDSARRSNSPLSIALPSAAGESIRDEPKGS
jgi:hypothetical protein